MCIANKSIFTLIYYFSKITTTELAFSACQNSTPTQILWFFTDNWKVNAAVFVHPDSPFVASRCPWHILLTLGGGNIPWVVVQRCLLKMFILCNKLATQSHTHTHTHTQYRYPLHIFWHTETRDVEHMQQNECLSLQQELSIKSTPKHLKLNPSKKNPFSAIDD